MDKKNAVFENFSLTAGIGVTVLGIAGDTLYESRSHKENEVFFNTLYKLLDCAEAIRVSLLYACYQARRFGGRYIFYSPSGFFYCASPLLDKRGEMTAGVVAGPFLMCDYDEYLEIDVCGRYKISMKDTNVIKDGLISIPVKTPAQALAINEQLFISAVHFSRLHSDTSVPPPQMDAFASSYSIEKEDALLAAISIGDIDTANSVLNDILGQILFHFGDNIEILRSRVVELAVLLSRAALRGGASIDAIFGLNYSYLQEIDALTSVDDIVMWLHKITRRFAQNVFDFAASKHVDIIYKAVAYIKQNYAGKLTLQDVSDHVFLSHTYFCKIFKEGTGRTPISYITSVRIEESKRLLRDLSINIADIPELVGFESQSYFTKIFKKTEGCTPGRYRQRFGLAEK